MHVVSQPVSMQQRSREPARADDASSEFGIVTGGLAVLRKKPMNYLNESSC
jgi:hypothetical protein